MPVYEGPDSTAKCPVTKNHNVKTQITMNSIQHKYTAIKNKTRRDTNKNKIINQQYKSNAV